MNSTNRIFVFPDFEFVMKNEIIEERISKIFFGGLASSVALFVTHPIDVIKLNLQVKQLTVLEIIKYYSVKNHGFKRIYKGIGGSMARAMVYCNVRFELYELARRQNMLNTFDRKLIVAALSGAIGGYLVTPMVKVHIRTQNDELLAPNERRYYKSLFDGLQGIYRQEGPHTMFSGAIVSSLRGMMSSIGQIALYDEVKLIILQQPNYSQGDFIPCLIASVTAGVAATLLQQPFDVITSRYMNAPHGQFKGTWDLIKQSYHRYGIRGFYKGLVPGFIRIVPQTIVTYLILEYLRSNFGSLLRSRKQGDVIEIISIDGESCADNEIVTDSKVSLREQKINKISTTIKQTCDNFEK